MWKYTRKGQLEIMGLVIIVILISLGMLFLLRFVVFKPVGEERAAFTRSQLATNTLAALVKTETDCQGLDMTELVQDCVGSKSANCGYLDSCEFLDAKISLILEETLIKWQKHYYFQVTKSRVTKLELSDRPEGCPGEKDSHFQPLPGGTLIKLDVCD